MTRQPDFAHLIGRTPGAGLRMDDNNLLVPGGPTTAHKGLGTIAPLGGSHHPVVLKRCTLDRKKDGWSSGRAARNEYGRLCKTIGRTDSFSAKAAGLKSLYEPLQGLLVNILCTDKGDIQAAQMKG